MCLPFPPHGRSHWITPSSLSITPGSSPPFHTVNNPGSLPYFPHSQSPWVPPNLTVNHPGPSTPHWQSPWDPLLSSSLSITLDPSTFYGQSPQVPPFIIVNHPHLTHPTLNGPSPPHCQSIRSLPSLLSIMLGLLPSSLSVTLSPSPPHCQSHQVPLHFFLLSITPGSSPSLLTVNHPGSIPFSLSITKGPSHPCCQSPRIPPLSTVNHPGSLPFPLSIILCPFLTLLTINQPTSFHSPLSITPGPSTPSSSFPLLTVNDPGSLPSSLSIIPGSSTTSPLTNHPRSLSYPPHCLSLLVPPLSTVNNPHIPTVYHTVSLPSPLLISPGPSTSNYQSTPYTLTITLGPFPALWSITVNHLMSLPLSM